MRAQVFSALIYIALCRAARVMISRALHEIKFAPIRQPPNSMRVIPARVPQTQHGLLGQSMHEVLLDRWGNSALRLEDQREGGA